MAGRKKAGLKAGVVRIDITPPAGCALQGHAARKKPAGKVHDNLFLKILSVSGGGKRVVIAAGDLLCFSPGFVREVKETVRRSCGVGPGELMLAASHTHTGPVMLGEVIWDDNEPLPEYEAILKRQIAGGVKEAVLREEPAGLCFGTGRVNIGAINRRKNTPEGVKSMPNPEGPVDDEVSVLTFSGENGRKLAVLFNYACHPTTISTKISEISADYPGVAQREIERYYPGCAALFTNGASGDVRPAVIENGRFAGGSFVDVERMGRILAARAVEIIERAEPVETDGVSGAEEEFEFPIDRKLSAVSEKGLGTVLKEYDSAGRSEIFGKWAALRRETIKAGGKAPVAGALQCLRLGDVSLVGLPGEVLVEIGLKIKAGAEKTVIASCANGYIGYIPTAKAIGEGGYEAISFVYHGHPGPYSPRMEKALIGKIRGLMGRC